MNASAGANETESEESEEGRRLFGLRKLLDGHMGGNATLDSMDMGMMNATDMDMNTSTVANVTEGESTEESTEEKDDDTDTEDEDTDTEDEDTDTEDEDTDTEDEDTDTEDEDTDKEEGN